MQYIEPDGRATEAGLSADLGPAPSVQESSVSELSTELSDSEAPLRSGKTSPSAVCQQRKMSSVLVTSSMPDIKPDYLEGRTRILCRSSSGNARRPPRVQRSVTCPIKSDFSKLLSCPAPLRLDAWSQEPAENFSVRGPNYVQDGVKAPSEESVFSLLTVDLVKVNEFVYTGLCAHPEQRIQQALMREQESGLRELPAFVFCVNLAIPGPSKYHCASYFGVDDISTIQNDKTPIGRLAQRFFFGEDDDFRDATFKLIPRIAEGNLIVRKAVGSKPAILGKKLKQYYIRNERYFEIVIDIGSNSVANQIVKLALGYAKNLTVDMMFLLEGHEEAYLPERILGGLRIKNVDFKKKDGQRVCSQP